MGKFVKIKKVKIIFTFYMIIDFKKDSKFILSLFWVAYFE